MTKVEQLEKLEKVAEEDQLKNVTLNKSGVPRKKHKPYEKRVLTEVEQIEKLERLAERKLKSKLKTIELNNFSQKCSICLHVFTNSKQFENDQLRHSEALSNLNAPFTCPKCRHIIASKFSVTDHFAKEHANLKVTCCCECSEIIPLGNKRLRRHILRFHHTAEEQLICALCGKTRSGKFQLEMHMDQYHSNKTAATCSTCGEQFRTKRDYQLHLRRRHLPRDLPCPHCGKKFENRDQAVKHLVI